METNQIINMSIRNQGFDVDNFKNEHAHRKCSKFIQHLIQELSIPKEKVKHFFGLTNNEIEIYLYGSTEKKADYIKHLKNSLNFHMDKIEELTDWMYANTNSDAFEKVAKDRQMYINESNRIKEKLKQL